MKKENFSRLSKGSFGLAVGVTLGLYMLVCGWLGVMGYCAHMVQSMGMMYQGYGPGFLGGILGAIWGFIDGFIGGFLIAFFYNLFMGKRK